MKNMHKRKDRYEKYIKGKLRSKKNEANSYVNSVPVSHDFSMFPNKNHIVNKVLT